MFAALTRLKEKLSFDPGKQGFTLPFDQRIHRFIIFSDQHKGRKNGADDFMLAEKNYLQALSYYNEKKYHLIALGDCEELWENTVLQVMKHNEVSFEMERRFVARNAFTKIVGNHDLDWEIDPLAPVHLKKIYGAPVVALQGILLETSIDNKVVKILCTHGHQGDLQSDGNWFSKFFIAKIWAPFQAFLQINPNTPAYDRDLKSSHNRMMYEWARQQKDLVLITGHTHQPVFESLTHYERLQLKRHQALREQNPLWAEALEDQMRWRRSEDIQIAMPYEEARPVYFNTGCCCFSDGDITGLEIADGFIRLIEWKTEGDASHRTVLEEKSLSELAKKL